MKSLLKISSILALLFLGYSCSNTDLDLQDNPNRVTPESADIDLFYNAIQLNFANFSYTAQNLATPIIRMRAMTGGNIYDNQYTPQSFNFAWESSYGRMFTDIASMIPPAEEAGLWVHVGAARTMQAYALMTLVDMFGDVPFSEATKGIEFQNPVRDDDATVYDAALALLQEAINNFETPATNNIGTDVFYPNDSAEDQAAQWKKAANSLLIRYYSNTRLVNSGAAAAVADIVSKGEYIQDNADDWQFQFGANRENPDSRHPYYSTDYEVDADFYQSNYYMYLLLADKGFADPRLRYYFYRQDCDTTDEDQFTLDCVNLPRPPHYTGDYPWCITSENGYWGRDHGNNDGIPPDGLKRTTFGVYPAGGKFDADDCAGVSGDGSDGMKGAGIQPMVLASYVDFMLAEFALTSGDAAGAATLTESAIRKSMDKVLNFAPDQVDADFAATQDDVDAYVTSVIDDFNAASGDDQVGIWAKEYLIALFGQGMDAYNMYRRTGQPAGMQPTRDPDSGNFPRLFVYPADHVNLNLNADQRDPASGEQVFWDTNTPNPGWVN